MRVFHLAVLALAVLAEPAALAADSGRAALQRACDADMKKLCPDIRPGEGRLAQCMRSHADALSDTCKTAIRAANTTRMVR